MKKEVENALKALEEGKIIVYPTDTIWGIGCDAYNQEAVKKIYQIKHREDSKSMLVLVSDFQMLTQYVEQIPVAAFQVLQTAQKPTTIIYPTAKNLADNLIADDGSVGIRITSDAFCKALIQKLGRPLVSTSANISGTANPANYSEIASEILDAADYVVQWRQEERSNPTPSSIVKVNFDGTIVMLRK